jgi:hypothetical protein
MFNVKSTRRLPNGSMKFKEFVTVMSVPLSHQPMRQGPRQYGGTSVPLRGDSYARANPIAADDSSA